MSLAANTTREFLALAVKEFLLGTGSQFGVVDSCSQCKLRGENAFCNLPQDTLDSLAAISFPLNYPPHVTLFSEGQPCGGVFVLCSGKVKVSASRGGKPLMLRTANPGDVLGLSAAFTHSHYDVSAETLAPSTVRFIKKEDFMQLLRNSAAATHRVIHTLGFEYEQAFDSLRSLGLLHTATARVAQLLLNISTQSDSGQSSAKLLLTQQQIAQMTATSRETVTRLLAHLRKERVIAIRGSNLIIRNRRALERMAS
jgi:CRP/FNR family cyclic AMP-dependent transcriptional regulator